MNKTIRISVLVALIAATIGTPSNAEKDIRKLSQNFIDPNEEISPWSFYPEENIELLSTTEHRGLLLVKDAGKGKDIKGILKDPIRVDEYPLPWNFELGLASTPFVYKETQLNRAYGLNLAVTFSDPSEWPEDRTVLPPETRTLQLLVVRIGHFGENGIDGGIPQLRYSDINYGDPSAEACLLYGRGDLAPNVLGNWNIPYAWTGYQPPQEGQWGAAAAWSWNKFGGPAESGGLQDLRFRVRLLSPTRLEIGFGWSYHTGSWRMRVVDVAHIGEMTGVWEIGPVISLDRWICNELAPELDTDPPLVLDPPLTGLQYYMDYANFYGQGPENFDHFSIDFDVPGLPPDFKWFCEGDGMKETWSNPGYLTITFLGKRGSWAMCPAIDGEHSPGLGYIHLSKFKPPIEMEIAFIAPDDTIPWNFWHSFTLTDQDGKGHTWSPGIQNIPGKGRTYINLHSLDPFKIEENKTVNIQFEEEIPQSLLTHEPVRMLLSIIDTTHIRVGLKGDKSDPWLFSKVLDTSDAFGGQIAKFQLPCPVSFMGLPGSGVGNYPQHQQFLVDYVHYRYGLTE